VPVIFNLAEPDGDAEPCCLMLPRMSYLPLVTEKVKSHFSPNAEHKGPIWFSHKKIPLRWHLPIGLLFDMLGSRQHEVSPGSRLPWSITVHFSEFPTEILLECPSREAVESIFMSSLKESDQLKTSGKVMKQMQAREHSQLWLGLCSDKFDQFWAVNRRLMEGSDSWRHLPIRVYSGDNCAMAQRLCLLRQHSLTSWNNSLFQILPIWSFKEFVLHFQHLYYGWRDILHILTTLSTSPCKTKRIIDSNS